MTTRVPLTRANILFLTRAPRRKAGRWLEALVSEGVLDFDSDDDGETIWTVRGAARPARGAERIEDVLKLEDLSQQVRRSSGSSARGAGLAAGAMLHVPGGARGLVQQALAREGGEKSLLVSGLISAFAGPFGWLYAGPGREALPAGVVFWIAWWLLAYIPLLSFFLFPVFSLAIVASGAMGVLYAWQYNRTGHTTPLLGDDDRPRLPGRR